MAVDIEVDIATRLSHWYRRHARALPWRSPPGAPPADPYRVWLSEIMLQQTTVASATPYFQRFVSRWPTVEALAAADDADLMAAWAGLGYYARARNLLACARIVTTRFGGRFPGDEAMLRSLPGIGQYTAAAIAAIAFDRRAVVVDGNVERVIARLFAVQTPLPAAKPELHRLAGKITPDRHPGDHAQAMMDLGATICTPRNPACALCPLHMQCAAFRAGTPDLFPVKPPRKAKPVRHGTAYFVERDGAVLLVRRPDKGLLGGMRALPTSAWTDTPSPLADAPADLAWQLAGPPVQHVFTHFTLHLAVAAARLEKHCDVQLDGEWWPLDRLADAGLPTVFAKAARLYVEENAA
jgi:A/G-specific adenine glycosylase